MPKTVPVQDQPEETVVPEEDQQTEAVPVNDQEEVKPESDGGKKPISSSKYAVLEASGADMSKYTLEAESVETEAPAKDAEEGAEEEPSVPAEDEAEEETEEPEPDAGEPEPVTEILTAEEGEFHGLPFRKEGDQLRIVTKQKDGENTVEVLVDPVDLLANYQKNSLLDKKLQEAADTKKKLEEQLELNNILKSMNPEVPQVDDIDSMLEYPAKSPELLKMQAELDALKKKEAERTAKSQRDESNRQVAGLMHQAYESLKFICEAKNIPCPSPEQMAVDVDSEARLSGVDSLPMAVNPLKLFEIVSRRYKKKPSKPKIDASQTPKPPATASSKKSATPKTKRTTEIRNTEDSLKYWRDRKARKADGKSETEIDAKCMQFGAQLRKLKGG